MLNLIVMEDFYYIYHIIYDNILTIYRKSPLVQISIAGGPFNPYSDICFKFFGIFQIFILLNLNIKNMVDLPCQLGRVMVKSPSKPDLGCYNSHNLRSGILYVGGLRG